MNERQQRIEFVKRIMKDLLGKMGADQLYAKNLEEIIAFRAALTEETDRGCALMAASYLESRVGDLLKSFLVNNHSILNSLFSSTGPLGSFAARIDMAYVLALIPDNMRHDFHIVRKIRNQFAHDPLELSFDSPSIADRCRALTYIGSSKSDSPRGLFLSALMGIDGSIHVRLETIKNLDPVPNEDLEKIKEVFQEMETLIINKDKDNI